MGPHLHIQLFGTFRALYGDHLLETLSSPRLQSFLAYLLLHRGTPQPRQYVSFLYWPDSTESQARTNLRKLLYDLRQALPDPDTFLHADDQTIRWRDEAPLRLDVDAFETSLAEAEGAGWAQAALERAVELYGGDLLPSCYDDWILPERERLRERYRDALARLAQLLEETGDLRRATEVGNRLLRDDPLHEPAYRRLMRLHAARGDRAGALQVYHRCVVVLEQELGVEPLPETQAVYEAIRQGQGQTAGTPVADVLWSTLPGLDVPMVGRDWALQQLEGALARARAGRGEAILISGEPGIGKSRLMQAFATSAQGQVALLAGASYPDVQPMPYQPIVEALRSALKAQPALLASPTGSGYRVPSIWLAEASRLLPELRHIVPDLPAPADVSPDQVRARLFEALSQLVLSLGDAQHPAVLCLDDIHWSDSTTLDWLAYLGRQLAASRLLVMGAYRSEEADAVRNLRHNLTRLGVLVDLPLSELDRPAVLAVVRHLYPDESEASAYADKLHQVTGGNPFFLIETLRALLEASQQLGALSDLEDLPMSRTVRETVAVRLGRLRPMARQVLEAGAVLGPRFAVETVRHTAGRGEMETLTSLDALVEHQVLIEGIADYRFHHELIRVAVYDSLGHGRRRLLHRRAGDALERQRRDRIASAAPDRIPELATQLARHFEQAGVLDKAARYLQQAGERAGQLSSHIEAIDHLVKGLALVQTLPPTPERDKLELSLQTTLGVSLVALHGYDAPRVHETYSRALVLGERLDRPPSAPVVRGLAIRHVMGGQLDQARQLGEQLLGLARSEQDPVLLVEGRYVLGVTLFWQGEFVPSREQLELAIAQYDPQKHPIHIAWYAQDPAVVCLVRLANVLWHLGYPDQALAKAQEALVMARELAHAHSLAYVLNWAAWLHTHLGDASLAEEHADASIALASEHGFAFWVTSGTILRGSALVAQGREDEGMSQMREGLATLRATGTAGGLPGYLGLLARGLLRVGQIKEGLAALEEALAAVQERGECWPEAELHRLRGELLLARDAPIVEVEACFDRALATAHQQSAKSIELRAAMSRYRVSHALGPPDKEAKARATLAEVYGRFTEGGQTRDLQQAHALLDASS
jgi:DNA-binding SARP family transcriptional activator/predicted ATPase